MSLNGVIEAWLHGEPIHSDAPKLELLDHQMYGVPIAEQRALLVRVFQRRLEHAKNLFYDTEQVVRSHHSHDGEPGRPLETSPGQRRRCRHWQLGDSFRLDVDEYRNRQDTEPWESRSMGADTE